jgi:hypothetical protein
MAKEKPQNEGVEELENGFNAKEMIATNAAAKTVIKYNDRVKMEVQQDTKYYKKGDIIAPHRVMAEQLAKDGIAKEVK